MTSIIHLLGSQRCSCAVLIFLFSMTANVGWGAGKVADDPTAPLPSAAQKALDKGIAAAKAQDYLEAIRSFEQARKLAPQASLVYLNLGLAESKIEGRELRAICWFNAYWAAYPNAENAVKVEQQISNLEIRAKDHAGKLIELLKALASDSDVFYRYHGIASLLVRNGNMESAEMLAQNQSLKSYHDDIRSGMVEALAQTKQITEAIKQIEQWRPNFNNQKQHEYSAIASAQIKAGLFPEAKITLGQITDERDRITTLIELALAEYLAGQHANAAARLDDAQSQLNNWLNKEKDMFSRMTWLSSIASAKYKTGQRAAADAMLGEIMRYADNTTGKKKYGDRKLTLLALAEAEHDLGRQAKAIKIMEKTEKAELAEHKNIEPTGIQLSSMQVASVYVDVFKDWKRAEAYMLTCPDRFGSREEIKKRSADDKARIEAEAVHDTVKASAIKILTDATASPAQRAAAWTDTVNGLLNAPIFTTDFKATLNEIAIFAPPASDDRKTETIYNHAKQPAEDLVNALNDIQNLKKLSNSRSSPAQ